jgi:hypothetical protein
LTSVALVAIAVSVYLMFYQLALTGMTSDERIDYGIAADYVKHLSFLSNITDSSQGRLSHLLGAGSFALLGISYFNFKLPFAIVQVVAAVGLWFFLRRRVGILTATLSAAMYLSCPYVLSGARAGATAGDGLVCALTLAYIATQYRYVTTGRFWPHGFLCAVSCGAAIGTKWTSGLLLVSAALIHWFYNLKLRRNSMRSSLWTQLLAHQWVAVLVAAITCPTLLLGVPFVRDALHHSLEFDKMQMLRFGTIRQSEPWYYVPALLISKVSPLQISVFLWAIARTMYRTVRKGASEPLSIICLLSTLPILPLALKNFQSSQYYIGLVPAMTILPALVVHDGIEHRSRVVRAIALYGAALALVAQVALSAWLHPDYLQAGRQFGRRFQGQFQGPAANHCQGLPFAIQEVNQLTSRQPGLQVFMLDPCTNMLNQASQEGPIPLEKVVRLYPANRPEREHLLIIANTYDYNSFSETDRLASASRKREATAGCHTVNGRNPDFVILQCGAKGIM